MTTPKGPMSRNFPISPHCVPSQAAGCMLMACVNYGGCKSSHLSGIKDTGQLTTAIQQNPCAHTSPVSNDWDKGRVFVVLQSPRTTLCFVTFSMVIRAFSCVFSYSGTSDSDPHPTIRGSKSAPRIATTPSSSDKFVYQSSNYISLRVENLDPHTGDQSAAWSAYSSPYTPILVAILRLQESHLFYHDLAATLCVFGLITQTFPNTHRLDLINYTILLSFNFLAYSVL